MDHCEAESKGESPTVGQGSGGGKKGGERRCKRSSCVAREQKSVQASSRAKPRLSTHRCEGLGRVEKCKRRFVHFCTPIERGI